jgi:hypothetical protein
MKKKILLGTHNHGECYVEISLENGKLSICGEEWQPDKRDIRMGGQCLDTLLTYFPSHVKLGRIVEIWKCWHLNDLTAGSPAQETYLRLNPVNAVYPTSHYEEACKVLAAVGLNPDPNYLHNGKPYAYGSAWLHESLPPDVIKEVESW